MTQLGKKERKVIKILVHQKTHAITDLLVQRFKNSIGCLMLFKMKPKKDILHVVKFVNIKVWMIVSFIGNPC